MRLFARICTNFASYYFVLIVILIYLLFVKGEDLGYNDHRISRRMVFSKSSKFFFRLNGKDTVINRTDIFAQGYAVRMNYDLPDTIQSRFQLFKRDTTRAFYDLKEAFPVEGFNCGIRHLCNVLEDLKKSPTCGFFCNIGKLIQSAEGIEGDFFRSIADKCSYLVDSCPYTFQDSSFDL